MTDDDDVEEAATGARLGQGYASLPNGKGAQHLALRLRHGAERLVALLVVSLDGGVEDVTIVPFARASDESAFLERHRARTGATTVPAGFVIRRLRQALDRPPSPALLAVADLVGKPLLPVPGTVADLIAPLLAEAPAAARSQATADALCGKLFGSNERLGFLADWTADDDTLRAQAAWGSEPAALRALAAKTLDARRAFWAHTCAVAAATAAASTDVSAKPPPLPFALAARDLERGRPITEIPLMVRVLDATLAPIAQRSALGALRENQPGCEPSGDPSVLDALLARAGLSEAWLEGFLVAIAASPKPPSPERWLDALVKHLRPAGRTEMEAIVEPVLARATALDATCCDTGALRGMLGAYDAAGLLAFGEGFAALARAAPAAFASAGMGEAGKRMLAALAHGDEHGAMRAVRPLLPTWIAGLRAARR